MAEKQTAVGVFPDRAKAERAAARLRDAGFRDDQIGFAMQDKSGARGDEVRADGGDADAVARGDESLHDHPKTEGPSQAGEVAAKGASTGAVLGGLLGAAAVGLIPGIGPIAAGGILAGIVTGAGTGAAAGGLAGGLVGLGIPKEEAEFYQGEVEQGRVLLTVKAGDRYQEAQNVIEETGGYTQTHAHDETCGHFSTTRDQGTVELKEEQLNARKESTTRGEARIGKRVVEEERELEVPVTREEAVIERRPVDRRPADREIGEGQQEVRVPLREEQVRVDKEAVVTEEVSLGKRPVQDTRMVRDTVKREEAEIEEPTEAGTRTSRTGGEPLL